MVHEIALISFNCKLEGVDDFYFTTILRSKKGT